MFANLDVMIMVIILSYFVVNYDCATIMWRPGIIYSLNKNHSFQFADFILNSGYIASYILSSYNDGIEANVHQCE